MQSYKNCSPAFKPHAGPMPVLAHTSFPPTHMALPTPIREVKLVRPGHRVRRTKAFRPVGRKAEIIRNLTRKFGATCYMRTTTTAKKKAKTAPDAIEFGRE